MINMVTGRSFAHEPIPAAIGSHGRENIPDLALLMDAMGLRYCCRLDGSAWGRSAAVSCPLPNGRGRRWLQGSKSLVRSVDRSAMPKPDPHLRGSGMHSKRLRGRRRCGFAHRKGCAATDGGVVATPSSPPLSHLLDQAAIDAVRRSAGGRLASGNASAAISDQVTSLPV